LALLVLKTGVEDYKPVLRAVAEAGGHIGHVFPGTALIGTIPQSFSPPAQVEQIIFDPVTPPSTQARQARRNMVSQLWNHLLVARTAARNTRSSRTATPPHPDLVERPKPVASASQMSSAIGPTPFETSSFMAGTVAVGAIVIESDGSIDAKQESWTDEERSAFAAGVVTAFDWWIAREPLAQLTAVYDNPFAELTASGVEPTLHDTKFDPNNPNAPGEKDWICDVLVRRGRAHCDQDYVSALWGETQAFRERHHTDWAVTIYAVHGKYFSDGSGPYAGRGGPHVVMTSYANDWASDYWGAAIAHEIGHIFFALDQYKLAGTECTSASGYLNFETHNTEYNNKCQQTIVPSIMRAHLDVAYDSGSVDPWARGQIGLVDSDGNGILDPLDVGMSLTVTPVAYESECAGGSRETSLRGRVSLVPYPSSTQRPHTINRLTQVEYQLTAQGPWIGATPIDGAFDSGVEDFVIPLTIDNLPLSIDATLRITDSFGKAQQQPFSVTISAIEKLNHCIYLPLIDA